MSITEQLTKVTAALDGLARNHSISKPQRRQGLISYYTPLQVPYLSSMVIFSLLFVSF